MFQHICAFFQNDTLMKIYLPLNDFNVFPSLNFRKITSLKHEFSNTLEENISVVTENRTYAFYYSIGTST